MKKKLLITSLFFILCISFAAQAGWETDEKGWKYRRDGAGYFEENAVYYTSSAQIDGKTYTFNKDGYLTMGWHQDPRGYWYYSNENGEMLKSTVTPDGYRVNGAGLWVDDNNELIKTEIKSVTPALVPVNPPQNLNNTESTVNAAETAQNQSQSSNSALSADETHAVELVTKLFQRYHITDVGSMHAANVTYHGTTYRCITVTYQAITVLGAESDYKDAVMLYDQNGMLYDYSYDRAREDYWPYDLHLQILKLYTEDIGTLDWRKVMESAAAYAAMQ